MEKLKKEIIKGVICLGLVGSLVVGGATMVNASNNPTCLRETAVGSNASGSNCQLTFGAGQTATVGRLNWNHSTLTIQAEVVVATANRNGTATVQHQFNTLTSAPVMGNGSRRSVSINRNIVVRPSSWGRIF